MPAFSHKPSEASKGGFGITEGKVEITDACIRIIEYAVSEDGKTYPPFCAMVLTMQPLDEDLEEVGDSVEMEYGCGKDSSFFYPADDAEEDYNEDYAAEVGDESEFLVGRRKPNEMTKYMRFFQELVGCGFRESEFTPSIKFLVGTKGEITVKSFKGVDEEVAASVFQSIEEFPYEGKKGRKKTTAKKTRASGRAKKAESESKGEEGGDEIQELATKYIGKALTAARKKGEESLTRATLKKNVYGSAMKDKSLKVPEKKEVAALVLDDDFLEAIAEDLGFTVDGSEIEILEAPE